MCPTSIAGMEKEAVVYFDGACKGNPGSAGYGVVLHLDDEEIIAKDSIGDATNNRAEYRGLIAGLELAKQNGVTHLIAKGDSRLIIRQMTGEYDVNDFRLQALHAEAREIAKEFTQIEYEEVEREDVEITDEFASDACQTQNSS